MHTHIKKPTGLCIELLESQGGLISLEDFHELWSMLRKTHSLDHLYPLPTDTEEFHLLYIIISKDQEHGDLGIHANGYGIEDEGKYRLAGFACLVVPPNERREKSILSGNPNGIGDTADIRIALLPEVQKRGFGRFVVHELLGHAFDTLRIRRVTASVVSPVRPSHSAAQKKQLGFNTKQICRIFETFGFKFEGISRGAVMNTEAPEDDKPVWHDVHRMSMLVTDYFEGHIISSLSTIRSPCHKLPLKTVRLSPWDTMIQRQEEEKRDLKLWAEAPKDTLANDACDEDGENSDVETMLGDDDVDEQDWDMANDFDD
ncbi:hypothetical protein RHS03_01464, partial [Rhizoctonia solani]